LVLIDQITRVASQNTKKLTIQREGDDAGSQAESKTNFRNTRWGMNKTQVVRIEGRPNQRESSGGLDIIQYPQKILDMDCMVGYVFALNRLAKAKYSFLANYEDKNQYISSYKKIRDILIQKYGKTENERVAWQNKQYQDDRSKWGLALSQGHLELNSLWKDSETKIELRAYGRKNKVFLVALYSGLDYIDLTNKVKAQSHLSIW
jgi:hypothetical protein